MIEKQLKAIEGKLELFDKKMETFELTQKAMLTLINTLHNNQVEGFKIVDERLKVIDGKINQLAKKSKVKFDTVHSKLSDIHTEIKKINKVAGYDEQYKNILKIVN